ncbi:MAG: hypothetical protein A3J62_04160 [Candidatus Buchananbacteria bacterium RIFCSPHIGHO2_02_FULL_38_8]|uniref:Uncharacterized protein n=2 Tax=Candidatus Buchananiibacteriota TaxID=1817903 RepID=A0A1G1XTT3_9BACT|nr:MAG: hypothetical protein A2731_01630 [Candidatus Buchananbacteria bacterium RIFCSPHIGHO2_01_FULL_39_8]OGY47654.1 MAG: hypothetical protein A3J62_04160 [Candidatus Buchananbacteria bacterium RIFCSPHIGHO2_02_FULL_38_8]
MEQNPNRLGALWVNQPKSERGPVLTGQINGQRVSVFKNKKWSEEEQKKQPLYHILLSTLKSKSQKA